ncbi:MAG: hypothetical protein RIQ89_2323 [Bacteroidota bacterium]|jgi:voltage-dependent potassium channel beta subunit
MIYNRLGATGLKLSALSFGSWLTFGKQVEDNVAKKCMHLAYDNGINFFDNAEIYSRGLSEVVMGKILRDASWDRTSYVVSSKVFFGCGPKGPNQIGLSRKHIFEACHAALKRMQVEYLDLFFCHRADPETGLEETVRAMNDLIVQGKVLYWGTSEWKADEITEAIQIAKAHNWYAPVMEQPQYNLLHRHRFEMEYAPLYNNFAYGTTIWSPLGSGMLTGKYNNGMPADFTRAKIEGMEWLAERLVGNEAERKIFAVKEINEIAQSLNVSLPCLAIGWVLKNKNVSSAILGASKPEQLLENLKALEVIDLLDESILLKLNKLTEEFTKAV